MAEAKTKESTPREDPIARAQRLLQETIEKERAKAVTQLDNARAELAKSEANVEKAVRVRDERKARVERLETLVAPNIDSNSYAAVLGAENTVDQLDFDES